MWPSTAPNNPAAAVPAGWRLGALIALLAAYALLSQWLMVHAATAPLTVALLFGPLLLAIGAAGWHKRQWATLAACGALLAVLAAVVLRGVVLDAQRLYVLQHAAIHLALAWAFALTLRPGSQALISAVAEGLHARLGLPFTPAIAAYTRGVTQWWTGFFVGMVVLSLALYALAPWTVWSFFCTVVTPLAAVLMFMAEYAWRRHAHPEFPRVTPRAAFEAYRRHGTGVPP